MNTHTDRQTNREGERGREVVEGTYDICCWVRSAWRDRDRTRRSSQPPCLHNDQSL